jgi:hypothetical protein
MVGLSLETGMAGPTAAVAASGGGAAAEEGGDDDWGGGSSSGEESAADWQGALAAMEGAEVKPRAERKVSTGGKWSKEEDVALRAIVEEHGPKNWRAVAELLGPTRTDVQCLHRWNKVLKPGLHKGPWTEEEDSVVLGVVAEHGVGQVKWSVIAAQLSGRIGKQVGQQRALFEVRGRLVWGARHPLRVARS